MVATPPRKVIMPTLPPELTHWILGFASLFSKSAWRSVQVLLTGAILAVGSSNVTAGLRVVGLSDERQIQKFHRVLNRAKWAPLAGSRHLLNALIDAFVPEGPLIMALDDTIERRRGAKISAKGIYRDPVHSPHSHFVKTSGLRWLCLTLLAPIPWAGRSHFVRYWRRWNGSTFPEPPLLYKIRCLKLFMGRINKSSNSLTFPYSADIRES
jgi:hypothetical protein